MTREEIVLRLVEILQKIQEDLGEGVETIDEMTKPVNGLKNFYSLTGVEATVICLESFNIDVEKKISSLFVAEDQNGHPFAMTVGQIADRIFKLKQ